MLIGLHGASRAGKDTIANVLVRDYGYKQVSLAAAIRTMMLEINPYIRNIDGAIVTLEYLFNEVCDQDWDKVKAESWDAVDFMIKLGQSARDTIGENVWIDAAFPVLSSFDHRFDGDIVVSDIRQPNEVSFVQKYDGAMWLVTRPSAEKRGMDGLLSDVYWNAEFINDGTIEELEAHVKFVMEENY